MNSIDWFKGKITGQSHDVHGKIDGFRLRFPLFCQVPRIHGPTLKSSLPEAAKPELLRDPHRLDSQLPEDGVEAAEPKMEKSKLAGDGWDNFSLLLG